ncbi:MAG: hypothetical protein ACN4GM_03640 [Gammaproteobacteria bacterium]
MKQLNLIIIISAFMLTASCSDYYAKSDNLNSQIDLWLKQDQYARIDKTLQLLEISHPDYKIIKARIPAINKQKNRYINKAIKTAKKQKSKNQWQAAIDDLELALSHIPDNKKLSAEYDSLITERDIRIEELRKMMLIRKARTLLQYESVYTQLQQLIPNDYNAQIEIDEYNRKKQESANLLMDCAQHALSKRDYFLATECLTLSNQLLPSMEKQVLLKTAVSNRKKLDKKRRSRQLLSNFRQAKTSQDYASARYNLEILLDLDPKDKTYIKLKKQLEKDVTNRLRNDIQQGKVLYSKGNISGALETWESLLQIDPSNDDLIALIARAKKVTRKIEKLEQSQQN